MLIATLRTHVVLFSLLLSVIMTFAMLMIGFYRNQDVAFIKAGGVFGLLVSAIAWYNACAEIWNHGNSWITLPLGTFPWAENGRWNIGLRNGDGKED
jgi:uncharacterized protein